MNKIDILQEYAFYKKGSQSMQREFEQAAKVISLPVGHYYFHENDPCAQVALIGKGRVRVFKTSNTGREITLYHVKEKQTCALTALCMTTAHHYPATAIIELPTLAIIFPVVLFRQWVDDYIEVRQLVFDTLLARTSHMMALIEEITFHKMDERLITFLRQQFRYTQNIKLTHEQIASELGSVREVISRLLKELEIKEIIRLTRGNIQLLDKQKLFNQSETL